MARLEITVYYYYMKYISISRKRNMKELPQTDAIPPFWTLKFHRKLKRFWTTPIQSLQISQRMGNSISPHLENAQKTGVCSLCGNRLSEVRAIHDPLKLKCTDLQLFSRSECTLYNMASFFQLGKQLVEPQSSVPKIIVLKTVNLED